MGENPNGTHVRDGRQRSSMRFILWGRSINTPRENWEAKVGAVFAEVAGIIVVPDVLLLPPLVSRRMDYGRPSLDPPCDEAADFIAGSCQRPGLRADGPWILAATILGSSMGRSLMQRS